MMKILSVLMVFDCGRLIEQATHLK
jgi:hypothetical protein